MREFFINERFKFAVIRFTIGLFEKQHSIFQSTPHFSSTKKRLFFIDLAKGILLCNLHNALKTLAHKYIVVIYHIHIISLVM